MLLEQGHTQTRLARNHSGRWLLPARYQPEESRFTAAVASEDSPAVAATDGECNCREDEGGSKLDAGVRDRDLCQERKTVEQASRQRWIESSVWSPMWPMRKVALFNFP